MNNLFKKYLSLYQEVREDHKLQGALVGSHGFDHAVMTAQYAQRIAENERTGELAWIAGLAHNTDRIFPNLHTVEIWEKTEQYLSYCSEIMPGAKLAIVEAVLCHSNQNNAFDRPVTVTLKDADRLANLGPALWIRNGQQYPNLPAYYPNCILKRDPKSTWANPTTVVGNIQDIRDWEGMLRLPKAKKLGAKWFRANELFINLLVEQLDEVDLLPSPDDPQW